VDGSKKSTSRKTLPKHSNLTPEEVERFLKSTVYEMIEAGDIASPDPCDPSPCSQAMGAPRRNMCRFETNSLVFASVGANIEDMILLVEDEAITRNAFADALRSEGQEVVEAADGIQALSLFGKSHVDLVITDLLMPRLNGFLLVAQIRATRPRMPILLISGYFSQDAGRIISSGSAEFMQKPIDPPDLIAAVQRLLH
jgi:CheY-like chemotaxis protein